jgi:hypothetical protein
MLFGRSRPGTVIPRVDPAVTTAAGGSDSERRLRAARSKVDQDSDAPDGVIIDRPPVLIWLPSVSRGAFPAWIVCPGPRRRQADCA